MVDTLKYAIIAGIDTIINLSIFILEMKNMQYAICVLSLDGFIT